MSTTDLRYRRTEQLLCSALFELLEEHGFDTIKINELTQRAGVSRQTFYAHYEDKYEFLDRLNGRIVDRVAQLLDRACEKEGSLALVFDYLTNLLHDQPFCLDLQRLWSANQAVDAVNFKNLSERLDQLFFLHFEDFVCCGSGSSQANYFREFLGKNMTYALVRSARDSSDTPIQLLRLLFQAPATDNTR